MEECLLFLLPWGWRNLQKGDNKVVYSAGRFSLLFFVNSMAFLLNFFLSLEYSSAMSERRGCSGSGSSTRSTKALITAEQENNHNISFFLVKSVKCTLC